MDLQEVKVSSKEIRRCIKQIIDNINKCTFRAVPVILSRYIKHLPGFIGDYGDSMDILNDLNVNVKKNMIDWLNNELDEETAILRLRRRIEYSKYAIKLDIHWMDHISNYELVRYIVSMCMCPLVHYMHYAVDKCDLHGNRVKRYDIHRCIIENLSFDNFVEYIARITCFPDVMNIESTGNVYTLDDEFRRIFIETITETLENYRKIRIFYSCDRQFRSIITKYGMDFKQCHEASKTFDELLRELNFGQNIYEFTVKVLTQAIVEAVKDQDGLQKETIKVLCRKSIKDLYVAALMPNAYSEDELDYHIDYVWNVYYEETIEEEMKMARKEKQTEEELMRDHIIDMELQDEINGDNEDDDEDEEIRERESRIWDSADGDEAYDEPADNDDFSDYLDSELRRDAEEEAAFEDCEPCRDHTEETKIADLKHAKDKKLKEAQEVLDKLVGILESVDTLSDEDKLSILSRLQKNVAESGPKKREFAEFMMRKSLEFANDIVSNATANKMNISANNIQFVIDNGAFHIMIPTGIDDDILHTAFVQQRKKLMDEETRAYERANGYDDEE